MDAPMFASAPKHSLSNEDRLKRITEEFREGFKLAETIHRGVTIFGSARVKPGEPSYNQARQLGFSLAKDGYTIITGGGPGIMEAANRGAREAGGRTVSFNIDLIKEQGNAYVDTSVTSYYFFVRKVMLASAAHAYVFFPGGFGTLDEFFEISTLIDTHKLHEDVPVVLMDKAYWEPLLIWLRTTVVEQYHGITAAEFRMWRLAENVADAVDVVKQCSGRMGVCRY